MNVIVAMKVFAVPLNMTKRARPAAATRVLPLFIYQTSIEFIDMGRAAPLRHPVRRRHVFSFVQVRMFTRGEELR